MSRKPVTIPTSLLIFKDIQLKGFWLTKWLEQHSMEEAKKMIDTISKFVLEEKLKLWMEPWDFNRFPEALNRACEYQRDRKVVLKMES